MVPGGLVMNFGLARCHRMNVRCPESVGFMALTERSRRCEFPREGQAQFLTARSKLCHGRVLTGGVSLLSRGVLVVEGDPEIVATLEPVLQAVVRVTFARSLSEAREVMLIYRADVVFIDPDLPDGDGLELVRELTTRQPELPVVVLTSATSDAKILAAVQAGAVGYLVKSDLDGGLLPAIEEALTGGTPLSRNVARVVLRQLRAASPGPQKASLPDLTVRETELLQLFAEGVSYAQAGAALGITSNTVRAHVRSIYEKLSVGTKTAAVLVGLRLGLVASVQPRKPAIHLE